MVFVVLCLFITSSLLVAGDNCHEDMIEKIGGENVTR